MKALGAATGSNCPDQPVCTFFSVFLCNLSPLPSQSLGSALLQCTLSQASMQTAKLWEKTERCPTLRLQVCSLHSWAPELQLSSCPGPWSLTELHGCAMPAWYLASPDPAFLTWLPGVTLDSHGMEPLSERSLCCLAVSSPSLGVQPPCCSLGSFVLRTEETKEI